MLWIWRRTIRRHQALTGTVRVTLTANRTHGDDEQVAGPMGFPRKALTFDHGDASRSAFMLEVAQILHGDLYSRLFQN